MTDRAARPPSGPDRLLYSVEEAAELLNIGRTFMFHLLATGEIDSLKIGRCRKIPRDALARYIERLLSQQAAIANGLGDPITDQRGA
jgi:excisionase family DNA binding protein